MKTRSSTDFKLRPNTSTSANFLLKYSCSVRIKNRCRLCMKRFCPVSDSSPTQVEPSTGEVLVDLLRPEFYKDTDQAPRKRFGLDGLNVRFPVAVSNLIQFVSLYHCEWMVNDVDVSESFVEPISSPYLYLFCSGSFALNNYPAKLWMNRMSWQAMYTISSHNTFTPSTLKP